MNIEHIAETIQKQRAFAKLLEDSLDNLEGVLDQYQNIKDSGYYETFSTEKVRRADLTEMETYIENYIRTVNTNINLLQLTKIEQLTQEAIL